MDGDHTLDQLPLDRDGLITHADSVALGRSHVLYGLHRAGVLTRVSRGVYRAAGGGDVRDPRIDAARYRQQVVAAAHRMQSPVFTSYSAAALLGLPIVGRWPNDVFILSRGKNGSRRPGVREIAHRLDVPEIVIDGIRVTAPEYTLIQLARSAPLRVAVVATDAAIRDLPFEKDEPLTTLDHLLAEDERLRPFQGAARVAAALGHVSPLADQPLESISRLVIEDLGFPDPVLQARFWLPGLQQQAWLDFYWPEFNIGGEADGHGKYLDAESAQGAAHRVVREKRREDELRPQLDSFRRWEWADVWNSNRLEQLLLRAGLPQIRPRRRLLVA